MASRDISDSACSHSGGFSSCIEREIRTFDAYLLDVKSTFVHYPMAKKTSYAPTAIRFELSARNPSEFDLLFFKWPLFQGLIYFEAQRVQNEFAVLEQKLDEMRVQAGAVGRRTFGLN